jgi:hypothetical protein
MGSRGARLLAGENNSGKTSRRFINSRSLKPARPSGASSDRVWQSISTNLAGADGCWQFTDNAASCPLRFYHCLTQ